MLVEVSVPLEVIGRVRCGYDWDYHVEVLGQEVDTDEDTYWRVIRARDSLLRARKSHRARGQGMEVDG